MLIDIAIKFVGLLIGLVDAVTPSWKIPPLIINPVGETINQIMFYNGFLPVYASLQVFGLILMFETTLIIVRLVFGGLSIIRGGGKVDL